MSLWIGVALSAVLLLALGLLVALVRLNGRLTVLRAELEREPVIPVETRSRARIAIEILNPYELAEREFPMAGAVARLAPKTIERIVYARAAQELARQLEEQGVHAEVTHYVD